MILLSHKKILTATVGAILLCVLIFGCETFPKPANRAKGGSDDLAADSLSEPTAIPISRAPEYVENLRITIEEIRRLTAEVTVLKADLGKTYADDIKRLESLLKSVENLTAKIDGMDQTRQSIDAIRWELAESYYKDYAHVHDLLGSIRGVLQGLEQRLQSCSIERTGRNSEDIMGVLAAFLASWGVILTLFGVISNHTMKIPNHKSGRREINLLTIFFQEAIGLRFFRIRNMKKALPFKSYYFTFGWIVIRLFILSVITVIIHAGCLLFDFNITLLEGAFDLLQIAFFATIIISIGSFIFTGILFIMFYIKVINNQIPGGMPMIPPTPSTP